MAKEKMSLIEQLQNPPRIAGGYLDEDKVVDLMRTAAFALSTMIGVASKATARAKEAIAFAKGDCVHRWRYISTTIEYSKDQIAQAKECEKCGVRVTEFMRRSPSVNG